MGRAGIRSISIRVRAFVRKFALVLPPTQICQRCSTVLLKLSAGVLQVIAMEMIGKVRRMKMRD